MFDTISGSLQKVFAKFSGRKRLSAENIQDGLREIRTALLEADVNFKVARDLIKKVTEKAEGEDVIQSVTPGQMIVKIFQDELTEMMGPQGVGIQFASSPPTVIALAGLQGSGKTTTCAKLAALMKKKGRNPLLVAADVQRPAAVEQLKVLGRQLDIPVYSEEGTAPPIICANAVSFARTKGRDVVILDTAGRLHIDEPLMRELKEITRVTKPHEIILVCDAMTGQDAVNSAREFNNTLELTGLILTKLDGDSRGGAAISIKAITGKPIKFVGVGEKTDQFEEFHPDRMASRILGMGDVVSLVEQAREVIDEEQAEEQAKKLFRAEFTFEDFLFQLQGLKKMGPLKGLLEKLPGGMGSQFLDSGVDEKGLGKVEAIIQSMTVEERLRPDVFSVSRKRRIARGAGVELSDVNDLIKQFGQMQQMMKKMGGGGMMGRMAKNLMPGMRGMAKNKDAVLSKLSATGKLKKYSQGDKKKKRKAERKRRKQSRSRR
jgi:signal recognition particle subunit SRP54